MVNQSGSGMVWRGLLMLGIMLLLLAPHSAGADNSTAVILNPLAPGLNSSATEVPDIHRIVGGQPTTAANVPYIVMIRYAGQFLCGGALITRRHVLTAAHCVQGRILRLFTVHAGVTRLTDTGVTSRVVRARMPRGFNMQTLNQDVAVLTLPRMMRGNNISAIKLCNQRLAVNAMVTISGWGYTSATANRPSNRLRTTQVPIMGQAECRRRYRGSAIIGDSMFCAGALGRRDSCSGDSGGPLIYNGRLCGVVSFGVGCAFRRYPGVYTSVNNVKSFIVRSVM